MDDLRIYLFKEPDDRPWDPEMKGRGLEYWVDILEGIQLQLTETIDPQTITWRRRLLRMMSLNLP